MDIKKKKKVEAKDQVLSVGVTGAFPHLTEPQ